MPQLFPMNWILLTTSFLTVFIFTMINIYFYPSKTKKLSSFLKKINNYQFKW
uniref:ATP synthase F0 subunit 8 n=1 Tax=Ixodes loricatus TaxID=59649 RepID=UPI00286CFE11|nr:ATP synthase F0 subunit 8 [Ixodes loricatus]WKW95215.1 ATP synthase subunit 8 [Ixodes loricatus]